MKSTKKWAFSAVFLALVSICAGLVALHFATRSLKESVLRALGPGSSVESVAIHLTYLELAGLTSAAPKGWPVKTAFSAQRVILVADFRQFLSNRIHITAATIENGYISALRPKEGGGIKVFPGLIGKRSGDGTKPEPSQYTGEIETLDLKNCVVELYDATVAGNNRMRVDAVHGELKNIKIPKADNQIGVDLHGIIKGKERDGKIQISGWVNIMHKASELSAQIRNVDLALFEPQLVQKVKSGIDRGTFNLDINSSVRNNIVGATGHLTLAGLRLKTGDGALGGLSDIPRRAAIGALEDDEERISLEFVLKGDLDDPTFSLTEGLGPRTALALLKGLGIGFEGLVRAFFALVSQLGSVFG